MCIICESKKEDNNYQKLKGVTRLVIDDCKTITSVPNIKGLKYLSCRRCTSLEYIHVIQGLEYLNVNDCVSLKEIPYIHELLQLSVCGCRSLFTFPEPDTLISLAYSVTPWLDANHNKQSNIDKLIIIQKLFRKWLPFRRLRKFVKSREFVEWYYHPDNKGGIVSKKMIVNTMSDISNRIKP